MEIRLDQVANITEGMRDQISTLVRLARVQKFMNWLECEVVTKQEQDRPCARKILSELKRMTGITPDIKSES